MWLITRDCCGLFCAFFTLLLMGFAEFVQVYYVLGPWKGYWSWQLIVYTVFFLMSAASHLRCMTQDPGSVPPLKADHPEEDNTVVARCTRCENPKPREAHHCSTCGCCIIKLDHHCPWVNNCVGFLNQKYFVLFLLYTAITCLFCLVTLICRFLMCASIKRSFRPTQPFCKPAPVDTICCVLNFVEAIMFGLFVTIMLFDQLSVVFDNTTYIDKLKGNSKNKERKTKYESLISLFGESLTFGWLLPKSSTRRMMKEFMALCTSFHYRKKSRHNH